MSLRTINGILLVTLLSVGCGDADQDDAAPAEVTVQRADESTIEYTLKDEQGTLRVASSEKGVELPKTWPKDLVVPPGSTVETAASVDRGQMVVLTTEKSADEVINFYRPILISSGWKISMEKSVPGGATMTASKDKLKASIVATTIDENTEVNLVVNEQEE